jgi:hypothetical protein
MTLLTIFRVDGHVASLTLERWTEQFKLWITDAECILVVVVNISLWIGRHHASTTHAGRTATPVIARTYSLVAEVADVSTGFQQSLVVENEAYVGDVSVDTWSLVKRLPVEINLR